MSNLHRQLQVGLLLVPAGLLVQMLAMLLLARHFGPETWGLFAIILAVMQVANFITEMGLGTVITKLVAEAARPPADYVAIALPPVLLAAGFVAAAQAVALCTFYGTSVVGIAVGLSGFNILIFGSSMVLSCAVRGLGRINQWQIGFLLQKVITLAVIAAIVLPLHGGLGWGMASWTIANIVTFAYFAACLWLDEWRGQVRWDTDGIRELIRESIPIGVTTVLNQLAMQVDTFLLAAMVGPADVGIYNVSQRVLNPARTVLNGTVVTPTFPQLCQAVQSNQPDLPQRIERLLLVNWIAGLVMSVAAFIAAPTLIPKLLGQQFAASVLVLQITVWALPLSFVSLQFRFVYVAIAHQRRYVALSTIYLVLKTVLIGLAILKWGMLGACYGVVMTELSLAILTWIDLAAIRTVIPARAFVLSTIATILTLAVIYPCRSNTCASWLVASIYCLIGVVVLNRLLRGVRGRIADNSSASAQVFPE